MWDELSALSRLQFDNFSDLIENGIKPDGHPAGVQTFLYYWTQLFGKTEWIVKLPFNLMGLASVYVIYKIGLNWFGEKSGLLAASFMATLQYFILYSPIARPYTSGLFLSLLMVHYWSLYMFHTPQKKYLAGFIVFAALSAYNHHFSLLFAAIVGFSGLFTINKSQVKEYIISGLLIFALYLPHMPVFIHQLGVGGVGGEGMWLASPELDFPLAFIDWAFQYSQTILILVGALLVFSIFKGQDKYKDRKITKYTLLFIWFSLPLIIGLGYSLYVNPVIQYSLLIFSFPYLLLLIGSGIEKLKWWSFYPILTFIIIINVFTLIGNRKHYDIIFKQPFDITASMLKQQNKLNQGETFTLFNTIEDYQVYYFDKYEITEPLFYNVYNKGLTPFQFDSIVTHQPGNYILTSGLPTEYIPIIQQSYPYLIKQEFVYTMENYLFSKTPIASPKENLVLTNFSEKSINKNWKYSNDRFSKDTIGVSAYQFNEKDEWGLSYSDSIKYLNIDNGVVIEIIADVICDTIPKELLLVSTIIKASGEKIWRGAPKPLIPSSQKGHFTAIQSVDTKILVNLEDWNECTFNHYIWNKGKETFKIHEINISARPNNPIRYGLFEKLH